MNWTPTRFRWRSNFSEKHLQFNSAAAEQLEFKHLLAKLVMQYCPKVMPETYCINDQNWHSVLNQIANTYYAKEGKLLDQLII